MAPFPSTGVILALRIPKANTSPMRELAVRDVVSLKVKTGGRIGKRGDVVGPEHNRPCDLAGLD